MNKQLIEDERHDNPMTVPQLKERMEGFLAGEYVALLCVDEHTNTLGYALVCKATQPVYLRQFFICRGQRRKGIGRQFFSLLLEYLHADMIDLEVLAWNEAGRAFWENVGCRPRSVFMRYGGE